MKRRIALVIAVIFLAFAISASVFALALIVYTCMTVEGTWSAVATGLATGLALICLTQWVCSTLFKTKP